MTFHIFINFLKTFSVKDLVLMQCVDDSWIDQSVISQTLAGI